MLRKIIYSCLFVILPLAVINLGNSIESKSNLLGTVLLKTTDYYRNAENEWCLGMRVFWDDGKATPANGSYTWYKNGSLWTPTSNYTTIDGMHTQTFQMYARYYDGFSYFTTPTITIGCNMSGYPITGCGASYNGPFYQNGSQPSCSY